MQGGMSLTTKEEEFVAASEVARKMLGLREMLSEIGVEPDAPLVLHVDNQAALGQIAGEASSLNRSTWTCDSRSCATTRAAV